MVLSLLAGCSVPVPASEPAPSAPARTDTQAQRLADAIATPGRWSGPTGHFEISADGRMRFELQDCSYADLDRDIPDPASRTACKPVTGDLPLVPDLMRGEHRIVLQNDAPRMPLYGPAYLDAEGRLHLGTPWSNFVWIGAIDDAGRGELRWTPMHTLVVEPGPRCSWKSDLAGVTAAIPCTQQAHADQTLLRFTVPPGEREPWAGEHTAVIREAEGILYHPVLDATVYTRE
jgi:hypothetical protein